MLLVSYKRVFIENETVRLCVTMWKRAIIIPSIMQYIKFLLKYHSVENKFLRWPF